MMLSKKFLWVVCFGVVMGVSNLSASGLLSRATASVKRFVRGEFSEEEKIKIFNFYKQNIDSLVPFMFKELSALSEQEKVIKGKIDAFKAKNFEDGQKVAEQDLDEIIGILDELQRFVLEDEDFKKLIKLENDKRANVAYYYDDNEGERVTYKPSDQIKIIKLKVKEKIGSSLFEKEDGFLEAAFEMLRSLAKEEKVNDFLENGNFKKLNTNESMYLGTTGDPIYGFTDRNKIMKKSYFNQLTLDNRVKIYLNVLKLCINLINKKLFGQSFVDDDFKIESKDFFVYFQSI